MRIASSASFTLRSKVSTFEFSSMILATCWVMVEAPIGRRPECMVSRSVTAARRMASGSTPPWVQKFWSSAEVNAAFTRSGIAA